MAARAITTQQLQRLPLYLNYLKSLPKAGNTNISATTIAHELRLNDVQVRKDLAQISGNGRPKIGYIISELINDLEHCLGYDNAENAVLVGAGNLGQALYTFEGFADYGLTIVAAFDADEEILGTVAGGKRILPLEKLSNVCSRMKIKIGIITVSSKDAQSICDLLIANGVRAIWNFAPVHLRVPDYVIVKNENLASSLAILSNHLIEKMNVI